MELYYIFIIISVLTSASSNAFTVISSNLSKEVPQSLIRVKGDGKTQPSVDNCTNCVLLPTYSIYIIGFAMVLMLIAIVVLTVALYLVWKKKSIFGFNVGNKEYVKHESTGVTPLYNANYDEQNKNNGSTLTVNSGNIEISEPRASDLTTSTRNEDCKIVFAKKPQGPIMPKVQMDAIIREVLNKVQKTDSASFRDLSNLVKFEKRDDNSGMKSEDVKESEKENKTEEKAGFNIESRMFKLKKPEIITETKEEIKNETKQETKNETTNKIESETKPDENKHVRIEVDKVESDKNEDNSDTETEYDTVPSPIRFRHSGPEPEQTIYDTVPTPLSYRHSGPEPEQTMYDTVPNAMKYRNSDSELDHLDQTYDTVASPKKFRNSGAETDDDIDDIPLYDLPPTRRSQDGLPRNVIQMDPESHYLMPISSEKSDSCYVNAKRQSYKSK